MPSDGGSAPTGNAAKSIEFGGVLRKRMGVRKVASRPMGNAREDRNSPLRKPGPGLLTVSSLTRRYCAFV
jgi:hypothetical protein